MGALSGNRLRPNADCSCYRSSLVDPLSARLPDRTPPRRGKRVEPSSAQRLAQSGAIREFVAVRPAGSDEGASSPPSLPNPRPSPRPLRRTTVPPSPRPLPPSSRSLQPKTVRPRPPARRRFVRQPSVRRVSVVPDRRHQPCSAANGWRSIRLSSRRQYLNRHGVTSLPRLCDPSTGPTWQKRGRGWAGSREPRLAGTRQAPCPDDRTPARGHADLPYLHDSSGGPPGDGGSRLPGRPVSRDSLSLEIGGEIGH